MGGELESHIVRPTFLARDWTDELARPINKLTARFVSTVREKGRYSDGLGLYLQVGEAENKSWLFRYQRDGQPRQMGLGPVHSVTLARARAKADDCRRQLLDGIDPIEDRRKRRAHESAAEVRFHSFKDCAEAVMKAKGAAWSNAKHSRQWYSTLETYVYPVIGPLAVSDVDTALVLKILEPIWNEKPETARRVRGRIETVLDWAKARGWREGENPAAWRGHLDKLLASHPASSQVKHHPALDYRRMGDFYSSLLGQNGVAAHGLQFLILTACRTSEVTGMMWEEIDLADKLWIVPADRMKAKKDHRVPLSEHALFILHKMQSLKEGRYVFPGASPQAPVSNAAFSQVLKRMGETGITVHGFRSTFRDWGAEQTAYPSEVLEMALAHAVGSKVEAAYRRGDLFEKRRRLMTDWASYCSRPSSIRSSDVVALGGVP